MRIFRISQTNYKQQEFPFLGEMPIIIDESKTLQNDEFKELLIGDSFSASRYIPKDELDEIIQKQKLHFEVFSDLLKVNHDGQDYWFEDDGDGDCQLVKDIKQWIYDISESEALDILQLKEEDIYIAGIESTLKELRDNPVALFHWTTEDAWKDIQKHGVIKGSYGTGINNRSAYGLFTSVDPDEYSDGSYGNVCLEINLEAFHRDEGESLNLSAEPEMLERAIRETLADKMGVMESFEASSDISPFTVVVNNEIPLKYVHRLD